MDKDATNYLEDDEDEFENYSDFEEEYDEDNNNTNGNGNTTLSFTLDDDEVVRIYLNEEVKNVQKVLINMKVDKMSIVNNCNI